MGSGASQRLKVLYFPGGTVEIQHLDVMFTDTARA